MKSRIPFIVLILPVILMTACATPITPLSETATATSTPFSTAIPTDTPVPATPVEINTIPGFEDWSIFNPQAVDIAVENGTLILTLKHRALWFMEQRGVLAYKLVDGDFKITADIHTAKSSDPTQPPGGDNSVQLGGLMARNGNPGHENYVFIVVGDDGNGLSIETKNTTDSVSEYNGPAWDSAQAELRICRIGQTFNLYKRHVSANEAWIQAASFERPDLPHELQVGVNIYTDNKPDLQIRYDHIKIEPVASPTECETE